MKTGMGRRKLLLMLTAVLMFAGKLPGQSCLTFPGGYALSVATFGVSGYSQLLTSASGGSNTYDYQVVVESSFPPGLELDISQSQPRIVGTPTQAGLFTFTVRAIDKDNTSCYTDAQFALTVNPAPILSAIITVTAPVTGFSPNQLATGTGGYFTCNPVAWSPQGHTIFQGGKQYTAEVTLTRLNDNHTFIGLTTATINGNNASVSNNTGASVTLSYQFTATDPITITSASITVTPPATGAIPSASAEPVGTDNFTCSQVSWTPTDNPFQGGKQYTASITLMAKEGYTFKGLAIATINGQTATITNNIETAVTLSCQFAETSYTIITAAAINVPAPVTGVAPGTTATGTGNFSIGKVTWTDNDNLFKGGKQYTATVTLSANSGHTFTGMTGATINGLPATRSNNTGTTVTLSHTFPETAKLNRTLTIANPGTKTFGDPDFILSAQPNLGTGAITFNYISGPGSVSSSGLVTITGTGVIIVTADIVADDFYVAATSAQLFITVNKASAPDITWPVADPIEYSAGLQLSSVTFSGGSTSFGTFSWTNGSTTLTAGTRNRSMTLTLNQSAIDNYDFADPAITGSVSVTVTKATPAVTLNILPTIVYGDPEFSIQPYASSSPAISAAPVKFRLANSSPKDIVYVDQYGIVTVNRTGNAIIEAYIEESANYTSATSAPRTITVNPALLYIIPENYILQQGKPFPAAFPVRYDEFVNGDDESSLKGELRFTIEATSDPMRYNIIASGVTAANYTIHFVKGVLSIVLQPTVNAWVDNATRPYGEPNHQYITIKYSEFEPGDDETKLKEPPVVVCNATISDLPGTTWNIRLEGGSDEKYVINIIERNSALTIEKAVLKVIADNKSRYENHPNPLFTFSYTGFKNGEDSLTLKPQQRPRAYTNADETTSYSKSPMAIMFREVEANDRYVFQYIPGLLTIWPKMKEGAYGDKTLEIPIPSDVKFTMKDITMEDMHNQNGSVLEILELTDGALITKINKSGETSVTFSNNVATINIPVKVKKKELIVQARDYTREQGKDNPEFVIDYSEFAYNENPVSVFGDNPPYADCEAKPFWGPQKVEIRVVGGSAENYDIVRKSGWLTITAGKTLPTAFTPNGDDINDIWPWKESGYDVKIFNRLGTLLYSGKNGWDGRYKNNYVQPGVYFYIATKDGVTESGTVEVIRTK